jgi:hypothetical protein
MYSFDPDAGASCQHASVLGRAVTLLRQLTIPRRHSPRHAWVCFRSTGNELADGRPPNELEIGFPTITSQGFDAFRDGTGGEGVDKSQTYQFVDTLTQIAGGTR